MRVADREGPPVGRPGGTPVRRLRAGQVGQGETQAIGEMSGRGIGELIQAYVHAKWAGDSDEENTKRLGADLPFALRERVDALGFEGENLLSVDSAEVLNAISALEREAAEEDARAHKAASSVRAEEERAIARQSQGSHAPWSKSREQRSRGGSRHGRSRNRSRDA